MLIGVAVYELRVQVEGRDGSLWILWHVTSHSILLDFVPFEGEDGVDEAIGVKPVVAFEAFDEGCFWLPVFPAYAVECERLYNQLLRSIARMKECLSLDLPAEKPP